MLIHLIRHGETDWNAIRRIQGQQESRLTERGRNQARELARHLQTHDISRVYCSTSHRTRQTADLLFHHATVEISYHDQLREINLGPWEGSLYDDLAHEDSEQFHNFWHEPQRFSLDGAENFRQLQDRGMAALREVCCLPGHDQVAIVSHGAILKSILCHVENRPLDRLWDPPKLHNCAHSIVDVDTAGNGRIVLYAGEDYTAATALSEAGHCVDDENGSGAGPSA